MDKFIPALLGFITAYFVFRQNDKGNQLKYITHERADWREKIRLLSVTFISGICQKNPTKQLTKEELINIREQIVVRLNPKDEEDYKIICLMDCLIENECSLIKDKIRKKLSISFASLLKHDWERAKNETKMESNSSKILLFLISFLIVTLFFNCINWIPEKYDLKSYELCFKDELLISKLVFWKTILYACLNLLLYNLLKYLRWRRKYRFENGFNFFFKNKHLTKSNWTDCKCDVFQIENITCNNAWNKYLGYVKRSKIS
jgi:hypothetical protein